jgi:hypothetical protein
MEFDSPDRRPSDRSLSIGSRRREANFRVVPFAIGPYDWGTFMKHFLLASLAAILAVGCGGSSSSDDPAGNGGQGASGGSGGAGATGGVGGSGGGIGGSSGSTPTGPKGTCAYENGVGRFSVEKQADFGVVQGTVADGVVPASIPELISDDGTCQILKRKNLFCTPACVGAETCGEAGTCIPYPLQISVGTVSITGLTKPTTMEPQVPGNTYFAPDADNPPFTPGSPIALSAAGDPGKVAPFGLISIGTEPLVANPDWAIAQGQALTMTWTAGSIPEAKIAVELRIDQHGTSPLSLMCSFDDTGSATVPSTIIDQLITAGVTGFPNGRIIRRVVDKVDIEYGCVELVAGSPIIANVDVVGFTPCKNTQQCPPGQTCNLQIEQCE